MANLQRLVMKKKNLLHLPGRIAPTYETAVAFSTAEAVIDTIVAVALGVVGVLCLLFSKL